MISKEEEFLKKYKYLNEKITDEKVIQNQKVYRSHLKEIKSLIPIIDAIQKKKDLEKKNTENEEFLKENINDSEILEMAKFEKEELAQEINKIKEEIKVLMLPKDSDDKRDIIMEIRAGTGGDEAALFVGDLFRMYKKFFENENVKVELMSLSETETGGFKEIIFLAKGQSVYGKVKFETGVHRVQRIPDTETNGRIHTSACTVAVLPEAKESEVTIEDSDLKIDTYRAGGAGGQHVNTTDSAVRITHLPTNTVVTCQDERSQQKNKTKAMKVLASRILANIKQQERMQRDGERKNQVGTGDRSERIRTYNYPQGRITDHRINKTIHQFDSFMNGEMQEIIQALKIDEKSRLLLDNG